MSDVLERVNARLDAMEAAAKAAEDDGYGEWEYAIVNQSGRIQTVRTAGSSPRYQEHVAITHDSEGAVRLADHAGPHIALNDPAAVLAMVAGLRAVVALHEPVAVPDRMDTSQVLPRCPQCRSHADDGYTTAAWPCPTLLAIAAMFPDPPEPESGGRR